jgi:Beta-ketoacyl synthase, N-terminal domain
VIQAYLEGIAFWSPYLTDWEQAAVALRGQAELATVAMARPASDLLPANERRRAPDTVAVSLEVAKRAAQDALADLGQLASVFASTHGDLAITDYMCATLAESPESMSPTRFHNSVHNAAAGYWSIATSCMAPYTAVSAWQHSFAAGLLECLVQVESEQRKVMLVAYDIEGKGALASQVHSAGMLACALVLSPAAGARARACIEWQVNSGADAEISQARSKAAVALGGNSMAGCLPMLERLACDDSQRIVMSLGGKQTLQLTCHPFEHKEAT